MSEHMEGTTNETITEEMMASVNSELEAEEKKKIEAATSEQKGQLEESFKSELAEMQKKMEESISAVKESYEEQIKERDSKLDTMKADFEKQLESISLRKSVSVNDTKTPAAPIKKDYNLGNNLWGIIMGEIEQLELFFQNNPEASLADFLGSKRIYNNPNLTNLFTRIFSNTFRNRNRFYIFGERAGRLLELYHRDKKQETYIISYDLQNLRFRQVWK